MHVSRIALLVSDTPAAAWVASMLKPLLGKIAGPDVDVQLLTVPSLSPQTMRGGLVEFVRTAAKAIKDCKGRGAQAVINGTPGYKSETALLVLLGSLLGAESFYLHEQMQSVVRIPAFPLRCDLRADELDILRRIGEASSRDVVRASGLASRPHLLGFVERIGSGREELWGLSALGTMLLESMETPTVDLPARQGEAKIEYKQREQGHMPADAEQLASEIAGRFAFVHTVWISGWDPRPYREGLLGQRTEDADKGVLRLGLLSRLHSGWRIRFNLVTTARDATQLEAARRAVAAVYGEVGLGEEISEELDSAPSHAGDLPGDLRELQTEAALKAVLDLRTSEREALRQALQGSEVALAGSRKECSELRRRLTKTGEKRRLLENDLKALDGKMKEREGTIRALESELAALKCTDTAAQPAVNPGP
jgi:putative CRISPR-associated protein (TIGR02619 family)